MDQDHNRADGRRVATEKEVAGAVETLEKILVRFRGSLKYRRERRARQVETLEKLTALRKETVASLKNIVTNTDRLKKEISRAKDDAARLSREETSLKGKYMELLSGRMPAEEGGIAGSFDSLFAPQDVDLADRREKFLGRLKSSFAGLDAKLSETARKRGESQEKMEQGGQKIKAFDRKRQVLFQKLEIYKGESSRIERELKIAADEEETLLKEYEDFVRRFKASLSVPPAVEKIVQRAFDEMEKEAAGHAGE